MPKLWEATTPWTVWQRSPLKILAGRLFWGFYICLYPPGHPDAPAARPQLFPGMSPIFCRKESNLASITWDIFAVNVAIALVIAGLKTSISPVSAPPFVPYPCCQPQRSPLLWVFVVFEAILTKDLPQKWSSDISWLSTSVFIELGWVRHQYKDIFASTMQELTPNAATRSASLEVSQYWFLMNGFSFR